MTQAMLIVKVRNGYAVAPFTGEDPASFITDMQVAEDLSSYSYGNSVNRLLKEHFEPPEDKPVAVKSQATPEPAEAL